MSITYPTFQKYFKIVAYNEGFKHSIVTPKDIPF